MTTRALQALCQEWQERLNLREWKITAASKRKLPKPNLVGHSDWVMEELTADVQVLCTLAPDVAESTLVHELLHIVLEGHKSCHEAAYKYDEHLERAINRIADALCRS